ncbi:MAG: cell division protein FtsZ [bacterium]
MPLNLSVPTVTELKPRITVVGVGGAGGNAVNNMIESQLDGVEFLVANTDAQAVGLSLAENKLQLGAAVTQGLGAGSQPQIGRAAAEESLTEIMEHVEGSNMLFITAGMGGGTGTGAAPVIAQAARERNILTVGVVTKPFHFEGARRMRIADEGIAELQKYVDTLLIIPNQNLFRVADDNTTFADAFAMADEVLHSGVRGITDLMIVPGLINLDFADVRSVMSEMGKAMMGTGESDGERRAAEAAEAAISNPLLDEVSMKGARGVLINITGGMDMKLFEVDEAANRIRAEVDPEANIIVGSTFSHELEGKMRVSVVATGIDSEEYIVPVATPASQPITETKPWLGNAVEEAKTQTTDIPDLFPAENVQDVEAPLPVAKETVEKSTPPVMTEESENPVGDVHARIRKLLVEDDGKPEDHLAGRPNPFRQKKQPTKSPLNAAIGLIKETFGGEPVQSQKPIKRKAAPPKKKAPIKSSDLFREDTNDDLDIPTFLRRKGGR